MLLKSSELLEKFIECEVNNLAGIKMPHMPTLGSAYEELTKQGLFQDFAIPKQLDLRVVSGFIEVGGETLPEQIDCMVVHGEGRKYGLTDQCFYDIYQVLCIFEIKKNLGRRDYSDAISHLAKIRSKFADHFEHRLIEDGYEPDVKLARKWFAQITGRSAPEHYKQIHLLSKSDGLLFYCLVQESLAPVAIIHGYEGYTTEEGIRKAFLKILEDSITNGKPIGMPGIPGLVTSNNFSIIKGNGTPFIGCRNLGEWIAVVSSRHNVVKLILEIVWSKISHYFKIGMPWEDGLHLDNLQPLLIAEAFEIEDSAGWKCIPVEEKEKNLIREDNNTWKPAELSAPAITLTNLMFLRGGYLEIEDDLREYILEKYGVALQNVLDELINTKEFMTEGFYIRPIHSSTHVVTHDDGTGLAAHERERFDLWCEANGVEPFYTTIVFIEE